MKYLFDEVHSTANITDIKYQKFSELQRSKNTNYYRLQILNKALNAKECAKNTLTAISYSFLMRF